MKNIWLSKTVKKVINEQAEDEGICVYNLIEAALGLPRSERRKRFKPYEGQVYLPPAVKRELTNRAIKYNISENKVLEELFDVKYLTED